MAGRKPALLAAQGGEVGVGFRGVGEFGLERDRAINAFARSGEVAALAGIAAQVELNRGLGGVMRLGGEEDFLGGDERVGASRGVGPRHPRGGLGRHAFDKLSREIAERGPVLLFLEHGEPQAEDVERGVVGSRDAIELGGGFGDHAELEVALSVGKPALGKHFAFLRKPERARRQRSRGLATHEPAGAAPVCSRMNTSNKRRDDDARNQKPATGQPESEESRETFPKRERRPGEVGLANEARPGLGTRSEEEQVRNNPAVVPKRAKSAPVDPNAPKATPYGYEEPRPEPREQPSDSPEHEAERSTGVSGHMGGT